MLCIFNILAKYYAMCVYYTIVLCVSKGNSQQMTKAMVRI